MRSTLLLLIISLSSGVFAQFPSNYTPTYDEAIDYCDRIAKDNPERAQLFTIGSTDAGKPLHYLVIDAKGEFSPEMAQADGRPVTMIMNGIHPGEACGINASIQFAMQKAAEHREDHIYVIIPIYNVGGALNRNSHTRANQNGPEEYGFRGNAKNLDLNRDFIKADSKNTLAFYELFHLWKPHILIDTHTSNGADYQPNLTLISTFPEKLDKMQSIFLKRELEPFLFEHMQNVGDEMIPYVSFRGSTPEDGIYAFRDIARYSTGYAALFNTLGFTVEAHMLKSFDQRVASTLNFLNGIDSFLSDRGEVLVEAKRIADKSTVRAADFYTKWQAGKGVDSLEYPGYEATFSESSLTGGKFVVYDQSKPFRRKVPYYYEVMGIYKSTLPEYYVIPQAWEEVIERLEYNGVEMEELSRDTIISVTSRYADYYETVEKPYEGHFLHRNVGALEREEEVKFFSGDYLIPTNQLARRYLANTLDPQSEDSFFCWNFFDSVLNQKEYFSSYLFEKTAREILDRNPMLRRQFEEEKKNSKAFAEDSYAQLKFIYDNSQFHEEGHLRIPVFEIR